MFTGIHLKNFKLYRDVKIDLTSRRFPYKPVVVFYGESGSGKTTIAQAFYILDRTLRTMQLKDMLRDLLDKKLVPPDDTVLNSDALLSILKNSLENNALDSIIQEYRTIGCDQRMSLEYNFVISGKTGNYLIEMDGTGIVKERLEYCISKNRGCFIDIDPEKIYLNEKLFETTEFYDSLKSQVEMYWGKHSFLSILLYQVEEKAESYIRSNISDNLMRLLHAFQNIAYDIEGVAFKPGFSSLGRKPLFNLERGEVTEAEEPQLNVLEKLLGDFFADVFQDIKNVYYKKIEGKEGRQKYKLYFTKKIEDYTYDIPLVKESTGTREILNLLPFLMEAVAGKTVIIDEYGIGMHDLQAAQLLEMVAKQIKGQLIIMTHNMMIMDSANTKEPKINPEALYFIERDTQNKKVVKCVTEIEERLHPNYNYRNRYLTNTLYKGMRPDFEKEIDVTKLAALYEE